MAGRRADRVLEQAVAGQVLEQAVAGQVLEQADPRRPGQGLQRASKASTVRTSSALRLPLTWRSRRPPTITS